WHRFCSSVQLVSQRRTIWAKQRPKWCPDVICTDWYLFCIAFFNIDKSIYTTFPTSFVVLPDPSLFTTVLLHQQFTTDEEVAQLCSANVTEATQHPFPVALLAGVRLTGCLVFVLHSTTVQPRTECDRTGLVPGFLHFYVQFVGFDHNGQSSGCPLYFLRSNLTFLFLLSTSVILQEYIENRAVAIFSMVFLGVGLYVFMNILTAIVYSEFRGYLASSVQSRLTRRRVATRAAFEVLRFADKQSDVVTSDQVIKLIDSVRISRWKKEALRAESLLRPVRPGFARMFQAWVTSSSFARLSVAISLLNIVHLVIDMSERITTASSVSVQMRVINWCFVAFYLFEELSLLWAVGRKTFFSHLSNLFSLGTVVLLIVCYRYLHNLSRNNVHLCKVSCVCRRPVFHSAFVEYATSFSHVFQRFLLSKPVIYDYFFPDYTDCFCGIICAITKTSCSRCGFQIVKLIELGFLVAELNGRAIAFVDFSLWDLVRLTNILLLTRAIRVVHLFTWTELVAGVLKSLPRNLAPVLGILVSAYYTYALLGMNLFRGVIVFNPNVTQSEGFECGSYQQLNYWPINFDDFAASIFLLWCLMVVNNWYVIVVAYQRALSRWVHVYMISWWVITVVGLLSLVTAFVIETFVHRRDLYTKALEFANRPREVHIRNGVCSLSPVTESRTPTCITPHSSFHCVNKSGAVNSENFSATRLPVGFIERQISMLRIEPLAGSNQRLLSGLHASSLDGLFRSELREPCEAELLSQVYEHYRFRQLRERTQSHRYTEPLVLPDLT
ncbi:two pore calcium channel protein 2, partial [Paragonimus westermani]